MKIQRRRGQGVVIATLIMVAASAMLTTIMLYWGLSIQGQGLGNFGTALANSDAAASEQVSIDSVLFTKISPASCPTANTVCFSATVYVRNFGDNPINLAGIHLRLLQSGISPQGYDCEVTTSASKTAHLVIVARSMKSVTLNAAPSTSTPGCTSSITFSNTWDGQTISVQVATDRGTVFQKNYVVPVA